MDDFQAYVDEASAYFDTPTDFALDDKSIPETPRKKRGRPSTKTKDEYVNNILEIGTYHEILIY